MTSKRQKVEDSQLIFFCRTPETRAQMNSSQAYVGDVVRIDDLADILVMVLVRRGGK